MSWYHKRKIIMVFRPLLTEDEIMSAFTVPDTELWWRAVHQLIYESEREAVEAARIAVGNHPLLAGETTSGERMARLRERLVDLRDRGLAGKDKFKPEV